MCCPGFFRQDLQSHALEKRAREALERAERAVSPPWYAAGGVYCRVDDSQQWIAHMEDGDYRYQALPEEDAEREQEANERFIAHARQDVPVLARALLDCLDRNKRLTLALINQNRRSAS